MDISKLSREEIEELKAQIKAIEKNGILATDKAIIDVAEQIRFHSKESKVSVEKFLAVLAQALGTGKTRKSSGEPRKTSRRVELQRMLKAAGKTFPVKTPTEVLEAEAAKL